MVSGKRNNTSHPQRSSAAELPSITKWEWIYDCYMIPINNASVLPTPSECKQQMQDITIYVGHPHLGAWLVYLSKPYQKPVYRGHSTLFIIGRSDSLDDKEKSHILPALGGSTFLSWSLCWHGGARNIYDLLHKGLSARTSMLTGTSAYERRCFLPTSNFYVFPLNMLYYLQNSSHHILNG